jgi:hypothetical protein
MGTSWLRSNLWWAGRRRFIQVLAVLMVAGAGWLGVVAQAPQAAASGGTATISGTVTDGTTPLASIDVRLYEAGTATFVAKTQTASDGTYTMAGLAAGSYDVRFSSANGLWKLQWYIGAATEAGATAVTVADAGAATADATLVASSIVLSGRVTTATNAIIGLPKIDVRVYDAPSGAFVAKTKTQANGNYAFSDLPAGSYKVRFSDPTAVYGLQWYPYVPTMGRATPIALSAGSHVAASAMLQGVASIGGTVTNGSVGLSGIDVRVFDFYSGELLAKSVTGAGGQYTVTPLSLAPYGRTFLKVRFSDPTNTYALQWYDQRTTGAAATMIQMAGPTTSPINGALTATTQLGSVAGTVTNGSVGLGGISVRVYSAVGGGRVGKVTTAADGTYVLGGLAPGAYKVQFGDDGGLWSVVWYAGAATIGAATPVTVVAGGTAHADQALSSSGHLALVVDSAADTSDALRGDGICADSTGHCTLRAAVDEANANPASDTITIDPGIDPTLTIPGAAEDHNASGDLDSTSPLAIHGNGTTLNANGVDRAIQQLAGSLAIDHLTITGGTTAGDTLPNDNDDGGAILDRGSLNLDHVAITGNTAVRFQIGGGGGIAVFGALTMVDSTVSDNIAHSNGGGVYALGPSTTIDNSTISGNQALVHDADVNGDESSGGLSVGSVHIHAGPTVITNTTVSGNSSMLNDQARSGGGVLLAVTSARIVNTSIVNNSAHVYPDEDHGGCCGSAGFVGDGGPFTLLYDTITGNVGWAGVYQVLPGGGTGPFSIGASIVSGAFPVCNGAFLSLGWNITTDTSCVFQAATDRQSTDPLLGLLANNGGATLTELPAVGSPAVDAIPIGATGLCDGSIATDQRGSVRPNGTGCDIGAVER